MLFASLAVAVALAAPGAPAGAPAVAVDAAVAALPQTALPLDDAARRALLAHKGTVIDREHGYFWAHRTGQDLDFIEAALFVGRARTLLVLKTAERAPKGARVTRGPVKLTAFRVDARCDARTAASSSCLTLTDVSADAFPPTLPRGEYETVHLPRFGTTLLVSDRGDHLRLPFDGEGRFVAGSAETPFLASQQSCEGSIFTGPQTEAQRFAGRLDVDGAALVLCGDRDSRDLRLWVADARHFRTAYAYSFRAPTVQQEPGRLVLREELLPGVVAQTTFSPSTSTTPLREDGALDVAVTVQRACQQATPLPPSTQAMLRGEAPLPRDASIASSVCAPLLPKQPYTPTTRPLPPVAQFAMGLSTGCARFADGGVACYGVVDDDPIAVMMAGLPPVDQLAVGNHFGCARASADGRLWCFGDNGVGQLGGGKAKADVRAPPQVVPDLVVDEFVVGDAHVCARVGGDVWCWGSDWSGESGGGGKKVDEWHPRAVLKRQRVMTGAQALFGGATTTCATDESGALWCWGDQDAGYSGKGSTAKPKRIDVDVAGPVGAMSFASGHSCLRTDVGDVWCRGWSPGGQLGKNGTPQSDRADDGDFSAGFVPIPELPKADALAASRDETCVVSGGVLTCLGTRGIGRALESACRSYPVERPAGRKRAAYRSFTCTPSPHETAPLRSVAATMGARCVVGVDGVVACVGVDDPDGTRWRPLRLR